jgi:hypothetical protein
MEKVYLAWNVYFSFLYNLCLKHFSHTELRLRWMQKCIGPHVNLLPLSDFNQDWNGSRKFSKTPISQVMKIFSVVLKLLHVGTQCANDSICFDLSQPEVDILSSAVRSAARFKMSSSKNSKNDFCFVIW